LITLALGGLEHRIVGLSLGTADLPVDTPILPVERPKPPATPPLQRRRRFHFLPQLASS
jgi:hypothetical protein